MTGVTGDGVPPAPPDFDAFWAATLADARSRATAPTFVGYPTALRTLVVEDATFSGFDGQRIKAWMLRPAGAAERLPVVVEYLGYGGGRSLPIERLVWPSAGYAYLVMDSRGQNGDTPDVHEPPTTGQHPGFLTSGINDPLHLYYRRLITDAVLAVDAVADHPSVDPRRIVVTGESQGGALALAVAGLSTRVAAACIDVPFLCDIRRGVELAEEGPYAELVAYLAFRRDLVESAFSTLAYVDGLHFAARATAPALFSTGRLDRSCPPETVVAAQRAYRGEAEIRIWPFNGHDAGELHQQLERFEFLARLGITPD